MSQKLIKKALPGASLDIPPRKYVENGNPVVVNDDGSWADDFEGDEAIANGESPYKTWVGKHIIAPMRRRRNHVTAVVREDGTKRYVDLDELPTNEWTSTMSRSHPRLFRKKLKTEATQNLYSNSWLENLALSRKNYEKRHLGRKMPSNTPAFSDYGAIVGLSKPAGEFVENVGEAAAKLPIKLVYSAGNGVAAPFAKVLAAWEYGRDTGNWKPLNTIAGYTNLYTPGIPGMPATLVNWENLYNLVLEPMQQGFFKPWGKESIKDSYYHLFLDLDAMASYLEGNPRLRYLYESSGSPTISRTNGVGDWLTWGSLLWRTDAANLETRPHVAFGHIYIPGDDIKAEDSFTSSAIPEFSHLELQNRGLLSLFNLGMQNLTTGIDDNGKIYRSTKYNEGRTHSLIPKEELEALKTEFNNSKYKNKSGGLKAFMESKGYGLNGGKDNNWYSYLKSDGAEYWLWKYLRGEIDEDTYNRELLNLPERWEPSAAETWYNDVITRSAESTVD